MSALAVVSEDLGPWIQSFSGRRVDILFPRPEDINIVDIAHALSQLCRYTGHCRTLYSVAEHCVRASYIGDNYQLEKLLHDAAEAYLGDVSSPLKSLLPDYKRIEKRHEVAIQQRFHLRTGAMVESLVKRADLIMLATEKNSLLGPAPVMWSKIPYEALDEIIEPMTSEQAEQAFLDRFVELTEAR